MLKCKKACRQKWVMLVYIKSDSKWKAHFIFHDTKGAHGLRPHMWPVRTCVRTYARNSKPIWKALYVEWSLEKDPSRNVNFKLWNYPLLNVLFISNQTLLEIDGKMENILITYLLFRLLFYSLSLPKFPIEARHLWSLIYL